MPKEYLSFIISGATCTGKTAFSLRLAKFLKEDLGKNVCIVNFDSLLFYKELSIGVAKPLLHERENIDHHLIDIASAKEELNAADYVSLAHPLSEDLLKKGHIILFVGGSGFYIRALLKGLYRGEKTDPNIQHSLATLYKEKGIAPILKLLKEHDPKSFNTLHSNDHYRIIRAVEYFLSNSVPISKEKERMDALLPYDFENHLNLKGQFIHLNLELEKSLHLNLIRKRTEDMLARGLLNEITSLLSSGFTGKERPLQSIGYKEGLYALKNAQSTRDLAECITISTRRLAKAQKTFFKRSPSAKRINPSGDFRKLILNLMDTQANENETLK